MATTLYRELPEQMVPAIDEVVFLGGPGEMTPPHPDDLQCDDELSEAEIPQEGLGFVVGAGEMAVRRTHNQQLGQWREADDA
ncbi:hypothetical protein [Janibacter terrae]|uniref:hypothetical protein n=1 Tax=Janibacter terrae TaxID=103817 RepID=UPI0031F8866C